MAALAVQSNSSNMSDTETTAENPLVEDAEARKVAAAKNKRHEDALKLVKQTAKASWTLKRQALIRRVLKAFEYLKNNPYSTMNYGTQEFDPIGSVLSGAKSADDPELYQYNDNIYQMLCLSFIAALSPDVPKVRWMPDDPDEEGDLSFSKKASTMMAFVERMNDMPSLIILELLYFWCAGGYFKYTRNVVSAVRGGTTKTPVMAMQPMEVQPNRYMCPNCGSPNPEDQMHPMAPKECGDCGTSLGDQHFFPAESMDVPVQVGENEEPNAFTALDIFCLLNVDTDPDAAELCDSAVLDLVGEMSVAPIRSAYPGRYAEITAGQFGDESVQTSLERRAREAVSSPTVEKALTATESRSSYSRCWIQPWAFDLLDDQTLSSELKEAYPKGCKLVTWGADLVLEMKAEALNDHWTVARTIKGLGMNPFGVGDVALSVQDRVDDTANNIHIYQDRLALSPILANANLIDAQALARKPIQGGRVVSVYPSLKTPGQRYNLQDALWQPSFHVDPKIYDYSATLMQLMQLLTGVQPQIFGGGTTTGVDTAQGQEQMLNTAMGRLMLFLSQIRSEHAIGGKLAVKCMAADIDDQKRITVEGDVEGEYENMFILQSEVQGEIHGFPQADQGFPASYGEMRDRLLQILGMVAKNPILENMLSDPDMQALFALYLLPDGAKLPGASSRTKTKMVLQQLSRSKPTVVNGMVMPSIQPDPDCDDMAMIVTITKDWMEKNYELATSNPDGYANARAYLKLAAQTDQMAQAKQAAMQAGAGPQQAALPAPGGAQ